MNCDNYSKKCIHMQGEVLVDEVSTKSGKRKQQPWQKKKKRSMALSRSFHRIADTEDIILAERRHRKANRIWWCATQLGFREVIEELRKVLMVANFCRERMCVMCDWRRSIKVFWQVSKVMDVVQEKHPNLEPIFLTLTVRNCRDKDLKNTLDDMFHGWKKLAKTRGFERSVVGWFRALEITVNPDERITEKMYDKSKKFYTRRRLKVGDANPVFDTYHPHFHIVLLVDKSYFAKGNKDYMHTKDWVQLWRKSCGLDYDPVCDIRKVQRTASGRVKVAEIAKYTLKDTEFIREDKPEWMDKTVKELSQALRGRRLVAFGGLMKELHKALNLKEDDENLINITDETVRADLVSMVTMYDWSFSALNYFRRADM